MEKITETETSVGLTKLKAVSEGYKYHLNGLHKLRDKITQEIVDLEEKIKTVDDTIVNVKSILKTLQKEPGKHE